MGVVLLMSGAKKDRGAKPAITTPKRDDGVVVHPGASLRDVERLMKYVKERDKARGRR